MGIREYNFINGPETDTLPTVTAPSSDDDFVTRGYVNTITGSYDTPSEIGAGGITVATDVIGEKIYVDSASGEVDVTANPQISAGTIDGQTLIIYGTSDSNYIKLENGTGLELNGDWLSKDDYILALVWNEDSSVWTEVSRGVGGNANRTTEESIVEFSQQSTPSNPASGKNRLYSKSDGKFYNLDENGVETELGGGGGSGTFNYVTNPDATTDASTGVSTGGTFSVARGTTEATFSDSYFIVSTGTTAAGTVDWALDTLQEKHDNQLMSFTMRIKVPTTSGTYKIGVYNSTDGAYVSGTTLTLTSGANTNWDSSNFPIDRSKTYVVRLERTAGTTDEDFLVDDVTVTPQLTVTGTPETEWTSYTPSNTQGFGTITGNNLEWRRHGGDMYIRGYFTTGTVTSDEAQLGLPDGLTIGGNAGADTIRAGEVGRDISGSDREYYCLLTQGDTYINFGQVRNDGTSNNWMDPLVAGGFASDSQRFSINVGPIPISDWAGSTAYFANSRQFTVSHDGSNSVTGPGGAEIPTSTPAGTIETYTLTLPEDVNVSSHPVIEISRDGVEWFPPGGYASPLYNDGTNYIGVGVYYNGTNWLLAQGKYRLGGTTAWSGVPSGMRWRVVFSKLPQSIGTGLATETAPGAVKSLNKWQKITLAQDVTSGSSTDLSTTTGNSAFKFNNLVVGNIYKVTLQALLDTAGTTATELQYVQIMHDSNILATILNREDGASDNKKMCASVNTIFKATASTVTFDFTLLGTGKLQGDGSYNETWAMIEEINNYGDETTDFT